MKHTCQNCKHWQQSGDRGTCELTFQDGEGRAAYPESLAIACYCEYFGSVLETKPAFSCNQWTHYRARQPRRETHDPA